MPLALTQAQVLGLAPDASAISASLKLARPGQWRTLGQSAAALWGECQGSALCQTQIALTDLAARCSCPSRKFPCKHALALLLMAADAPQSLPELPEPEWVKHWAEHTTRCSH